MQIKIGVLLLSILLGQTPSQNKAVCDIEYIDFSSATIVFSAGGYSPSWQSTSFSWDYVQIGGPNLQRYLYSGDVGEQYAKDLVLYLYSEPIYALQVYDSKVIVTMSCKDVLGEDYKSLNSAQKEYIKKRLQLILYKIIAATEGYYHFKYEVTESDAKLWPKAQRLPPPPMSPY